MGTVRKTHLRGRYAAEVRREVVSLRTVELSIVLAGVLLAWGQCAWAAFRMRRASLVWPVLLYDEPALDL